MIKKYNEFINEGIFDLLSGYSMEEVKEKLKHLTPIERFYQLKKLELSYQDVYTQEEIDNFTGLDKVLASNKYDWISDIYGNKALVYLNNKYGLIDEYGNEIIAVKYDSIGYFNKSNISKVCLNNKYGFIDMTGKEITPIKYDYAGEFGTYKAYIELNGKTGYVDKEGNEHWK